MCEVKAIESVMKTFSSGDNLHDVKATSFEDLPTVKKVIGRMSDAHVYGSKVYEGVLLMNFEGSLTFLKKKASRIGVYHLNSRLLT